MLVARTTGRHQVAIEEQPEPSLSPGHVAVTMTHVALCGTDLHIWEDAFPAAQLPVVQGHEMAGVVAALGEGAPELAPDLAVGDVVAVNPTSACGECAACRRGRFNVCTSLRVIGCYEDGGLAQTLVVPADKVVKAPEGLSGELASLGESASIALQAVNRGRPSAFETAVVIGCGPIGLFAIRSLVDRGLRVVAADVDAHRVELAQQFGAQLALVVDPNENFPTRGQSEELQDFAGPDGVDLVVEATGVPSCTAAAVELVAPCGRVVQVGMSKGEAPVSIAALTRKEVDLIGSRNSLGLIPDGLSLIDAHRGLVEQLITHRFAMEKLQEAFELWHSRTEPIGKIVIAVPPQERS